MTPLLPREEGQKGRIHLGFRQFTTVKQGRNAREMDVLDTWKGVVKDICASQPDLITIAGDVHHR